MLTVREAVERAYGPVPGVTLHLAATITDGYPGFYLAKMSRTDNACTFLRFDDEWVAVEDVADYDMSSDIDEGPDISDRPASAFLGFFGEPYDQVVSDYLKAEGREGAVTEKTVVWAGALADIAMTVAIESDYVKPAIVSPGSYSDKFTATCHGRAIEKTILSYHSAVGTVAQSQALAARVEELEKALETMVDATNETHYEPSLHLARVNAQKVLGGGG